MIRKSMPSGRDRWLESGFPRDKREAFVILK
jgi:hypothetical protein